MLALARHLRQKTVAIVRPLGTTMRFNDEDSLGRIRTVPTGRTSQLLDFIRNLTETETARKVSDRELLSRFIGQHDETAFRAIVRRHGPMVFRLCLRVLCREKDAEDAFQATFLILVKKAAAVQRQESVGSWLFGVAQRVACKMKATLARRRARESQAAEKPYEDPLAQTSVREALELLHGELARLPEKYRAPLVLYCLEGATRDEVAQQLGLTLRTLKKRLELGRELLRNRLNRRGLTIPAALLAILLCERGASAAISAGLVISTVKAATLVAAGSAVTSVVSVEVAALTEGVMKAMFFTKLKSAMVLLVAVSLLGLASVMATQDFAKDGQVNPKSPDALQKEDDSAKGGLKPSWKAQATLEGHKDEVLCLTFGVDQLATASKDGSIKLWNVANAKEEGACKYPVELGPMRSMAFTPDGKTALLVFGEHIGVWDTSKNGFPKATIGGASPLALDSGDDGFRLVLRHTEDSGKNLQIMVISRFGSQDEELGFGPSESKGLLGHNEVEIARLSQDGAVLASGTADKAITLWKVSEKKEQAVCKGHTDALLAVEFSPDGKILASSSKDGTVRLWDVATGKELAVLKGHEGQVHCVAFSPDSNTLASGGTDKMIVLWDVKAAKRLTVLKGHTEGVLHVAFSRGGNMLASASKDKTVKLWEPEK
jgi:RNA polymerase sigma factor (sigma-70 family)